MPASPTRRAWPAIRIPRWRRRSWSGRGGGESVMPEYEISTTRRDEFDEIMAMTRRAVVFNEKEVDTVTELLEGYEEGPEISGYNFLSCREIAHPERNEVQSKDERNEVQSKDERNEVQSKDERNEVQSKDERNEVQSKDERNEV